MVAVVSLGVTPLPTRAKLVGFFTIEPDVTERNLREVSREVAHGHLLLAVHPVDFRVPKGLVHEGVTHAGVETVLRLFERHHFLKYTDAVYFRTMDTNLRAEVLSAFIKNGSRVEDLPQDDPTRATGVAIGDMFTSGVGFLASEFFPNVPVRKLMRLVWDLVGHSITPIALGPNVPTLSIAVLGSRVAPQAVIFPPHNWIDMVKSDPVMQMGALVCVGSQAVDFYNGKVLKATDSPGVITRAKAYEAEFLLALQKTVPSMGTEWNEYQKAILEEMPNGISSPKVIPLLYTSKPFVALS